MDIENPLVVPPQIVTSRPGVALWRWWVSLLIIGAAPLLAAISSTKRAHAGEVMLPKSVQGLLFFCVLQLALFGVFWGLAWLFSRANRDDLFLRWHDGWKAIGWGALYAVAMRIAVMALGLLVLIVIVTVLSMMGIAPEKLVAIVKRNTPDTGKMFSPMVTQGSLFFRILLITLVSFVVAGFREELWRSATMAGILHVAPKRWSEQTRTGVTIVVSSVLFGLAHMYQGWLGVGVTGVLGVFLGAITLRHRSIWPSVFAHGFFDATTFAMLYLIKR